MYAAFNFLVIGRFWSRLSCLIGFIPFHRCLKRLSGFVELVLPSNDSVDCVTLNSLVLLSLEAPLCLTAGFALPYRDDRPQIVLSHITMHVYLHGSRRTFLTEEVRSCYKLRILASLRRFYKDEKMVSCILTFPGIGGIVLLVGHSAPSLAPSIPLVL